MSVASVSGRQQHCSISVGPKHVHTPQPRASRAGQKVALATACRPSARLSATAAGRRWLELATWCSEGCDFYSEEGLQQAGPPSAGLVHCGLTLKLALQGQLRLFLYFFVVQLLFDR